LGAPSISSSFSISKVQLQLILDLWFYDIYYMNHLSFILGNFLE
jgi:hypothetical protein